MLGGADNPNGELLSYIIGADNVSTLIQILVFLPLIPNVVLHVEYGS